MILKTLAAGLLAAATLHVPRSFATPLADVTALSAGGRLACVVQSAGNVKCWGDLAGLPTGIPADITGVAGASAVSVGRRHACAVVTAGAVRCWGIGTLGDGISTSNLAGVAVLGLTGATAVAAGGRHTCALTAARGVRCWGSNDRGQLGDGTVVDRVAPVDVVGLPAPVVAIGVGEDHACAVVSGGAVYCWGDNTQGQVSGAQDLAARPNAVQVVAAGAVSVAGGFRHTCAAIAGGTAKCWGGNFEGQTARPAHVAFQAPQDVGDSSGTFANVSAISTGTFQTCAIRSGTVWCWGDNSESELGINTCLFACVPQPVDGLPAGIASVSAGDGFTCVRTVAGGADCWGINLLGQLGRGAVGTPQGDFRPASVGIFFLQSLAFPRPPNLDVNTAAFVPAATATSGLPVTFTSFTTNVCTASGSIVTLVSIGLCTLQATQPGNFAFAPAAALQQTFLVSGSTPSMPTRLANISTRGLVANGDDVLIGGFVIGGATSKTVVVTAVGPSLAAAGVAQALPNPALTLVRSSDQSVIATNNDWQQSPDAATLQMMGLAPANPNEAAIMATLPPGAYTAIVSGEGDTIGVGIVAVYEIDSPGTPLINISTRGESILGDEVLIGGFVIQGNAPQRVAVVATGPSLFGAGLVNALPDTTLTLVRSSDQAVVASNDDWQAGPNAAALRFAGFAPGDAREAAVLVTLQPGAYTAILAGAGGLTGVALIGVFAAP
jgi:Regulator of Chromosome Condensation (RCC1) repeat protein/regulator of chromosome condensation (RCC1) repeat-containing protein